MIPDRKKNHRLAPALYFHNIFVEVHSKNVASVQDFLFDVEGNVIIIIFVHEQVILNRLASKLRERLSLPFQIQKGQKFLPATGTYIVVN